ncbi:MAG: endonuclease III [Puniceicoccales bacterium]|nr:endonuclease III [Puniceicoccales bacterium]
MDYLLRGRGAVVESMLFRQFPHVDRFLDFSSTFQLLVAVVLSARCTDAQVNRVTPALFAAAPNAHVMADFPLAKLENLIHGVGFFRQKAKALSALSQILVTRWNGVVPLTFEDLEFLPGVGHKTAAVVLGVCTNQPTFPVDTHVYRLSRRWRLSDGRTPIAVERDLKQIFTPVKWFPLHQRMIAYGRNDCTARKCDGTRCAICRAMAAMSLGQSIRQQK